MKYLKNYELFERYTHLDEVISFLEINCHMFLDEIDDKCLVYRGYDTKDTDVEITDGMYIKDVRKDRRPLSTATSLHDQINQRFDDIYGKKIRSESVFATTDKEQTWIYGNRFLFFPIGDYEYYWSPEVKDLYTEVYTIEEFEKLIHTYKSNNIEKSNRNEVMFLCDKYYLVEYRYEDGIKDYLSKRKT